MQFAIDSLPHRLFGMLCFQTLLLAALALLELCGSAPTPHHPWLPLPEWGGSEPVLSSWDYLGLGNAYPVHSRVDSHETWLPQPAATPTIEIVRAFRKPAVDPNAWAQIPVIGGGRDNTRLFVALVPRGFEDFVLVRKPFVIVEETDQPSKDKSDKNGSKDDKDDKNSSKDDNPPKERTDDTTKKPEPTVSSTSTTVTSTTPTTTSTTPSTSTTPADDNENAAEMNDDAQQSKGSTPQK